MHALSRQLNNLYYRANSRARKQRARTVFAAYTGIKPTSMASANIVADPLRTRRIVAAYQKTLEVRIDRVRSLSKKTVKRSLAGGALVAEGKKDGKVGEFNKLNPDLAAAEFEAWARATMLQVLLDSAVTVTVPVAGHYLVSLNAQTIGVAAVQAYDKASKAGIAISDELVEFVERVRSFEPAEVAATRQFGLLRNMSFDAADEMRDELVAGMRLGKTAEDIAQAIDGKLSSINLARARTIARTEITGAHANATLNSFQISGVQLIEAIVEFALNQHGSAEPCPLCIALAGRQYRIDDARGVIPVHPNCQCGWLPVGIQ